MSAGGDGPQDRVRALLARNAGGAPVAAGEILRVAPRRLLLDGAGGVRLLDAMHGACDELRHGRCLVLVDGADFPRARRAALSSFAARLGAGLALDPVHRGWPEQVATEEGLVDSAELSCALDPGVRALGGLGHAVLLVDLAQACLVLRDGTLPWELPATLHARIGGKLPRWVTAFDLARGLLTVLGGAAGVAGRVVQLGGDTLDGLSIDERMGLCAALGRAGVWAIVPPDAATRAWLAARQATPLREADPAPGAPPSQAAVTLDASTLTPTAAAGSWSGPAVDLASPNNPPLDQVVLGGRLADLRLACQILAERPLHRGLDLVIVPASRRVLVQALEEGLVNQLVRAGARVLPPGSAPPAPAPGEVRVTTVTPGEDDLLCGPALAAAAALAGRLMEIEAVHKRIRRGAAMH